MKLSERGIIIRKTAEQDLRGIYLAANELSPDRLSTDCLADMFMSDDYSMFTAVRKKTVIGFISGKISGNVAVIKCFMVKEKFRKSGIGSSILNTFTAAAKKKGVDIFSITVYEDNDESLPFLRNRGFSVKGSKLLQMKRDQ